MLANLQEYIFKKVLSFDVGVKHPSLCEIDFNKHSNMYSISKWSIISLRGKNISDYTRNLIETLRQYEFGHLDFVLIEQQLNRNTQMKVLSHVIQTFFICERRIINDRIQFVSPKIKFSSPYFAYNNIVEKCRTNLELETANRFTLKKLSVKITEEVLDEENSKWLEYFKNQVKKDDLADCFLQAYAWHVNFKSQIPVEIDLDDI
jgi:hypothetical protein